MPSPSPTPEEREHLDRARRGDEDAFRLLVEPHRTKLHAHCYRMLGSFHDADDTLQEILLRAWRGLHRFDDRKPLRPWLYKIATNACLDTIGRRPKRVLPMDYGMAPNLADREAVEPLVEPVWLEPYPDAGLGMEDGYAAPDSRYEEREAVELAFIAALQHLPPQQRAVLIMRDVLGFSAREVAENMETTVASVNSALQRAHRTVEERLPVRSQQATPPSPWRRAHQHSRKNYVAAWENADVEALVTMLAEDVTMAMPPYPAWWRGRDELLAAVTRPGSPFYARWRYLPARANGQLAFGGYVWDQAEGVFAPNALGVLALEGDRVTQMIGFATPSLFALFGLPAQLGARDAS